MSKIVNLLDKMKLATEAFSFFTSNTDRINSANNRADDFIQLNELDEPDVSLINDHEVTGMAFKATFLSGAFNDIKEVISEDVCPPSLINLINEVYDLYMDTDALASERKRTHRSACQYDLENTKNFLRKCESLKLQTKETLDEAKLILADAKLILSDVEGEESDQRQTLKVTVDEIVERLFTSEIENVTLNSTLNVLLDLLEINKSEEPLKGEINFNCKPPLTEEFEKLSYSELATIIGNEPLSWDNKFQGIGSTRKKQIEDAILKSNPKSELALLIAYYRHVSNCGYLGRGMYYSGNQKINYLLDKSHREMKLKDLPKTVFNSHHASPKEYLWAFNSNLRPSPLIGLDDKWF